MIVSSFEFSFDRLERFGGSVCEGTDNGVPFTSEFSLKSTIRPDVVPAICAVDERAVGQIVGELEDGTAAIRALYLDADGSLSQGPILPVDQI